MDVDRGMDRGHAIAVSKGCRRSCSGGSSGTPELCETWEQEGVWRPTSEPGPEAAGEGRVEFSELASKGVMSGKSAFVTFNLFKREILFSEDKPVQKVIRKAELLATANGEN